MFNEEEFINNKDLREKMKDRVDVLDKVKELLLLPGNEYATTNQVAKYYVVEKKTIQKLAERNRDELLEDGLTLKNYKEIMQLVNTDNASALKIPPNGTLIFPKRAILRVGMLLQDSEIAKEVRTQLLNIEENSTAETKSQSIDEEKQLVLNIVFAKDEVESATAIRDLLDYKNRYIHKIESENTALADGVLKWGSREAINRMVRQIAGKVFEKEGKYKYVKAWDKLKAEMLYKYNIGITARIKNSGNKNATFFDILDNEELKMAVKTCVALCEMYKINIDNLLIEN